jgi:hypothetical protein
MNTAQHTPGPWVITEGDALTNFIYDDLGEDGCLEPIASVSHGDPVELDANTLLIAAAPELLALAYKVAGLNPVAGEIGAGMLAQLVEAASIAIGKATGSQP